MASGPVGSLKSPEDEDRYEVFEDEGLRVHVSSSALGEADTRGRIEFHFGSFGLCRFWLDGE